MICSGERDYIDGDGRMDLYGRAYRKSEFGVGHLGDTFADWIRSCRDC